MSDESAESRGQDQPVGLRGGLRRLGTFLVVYGAIGLAIALLGSAALLWAGGRMSGLADRVSAQVDELATTIEASAAALDDAGATALSFAVTLERTPPTVRQAADTIRNLRPNLQALQSDLAAVSILGRTPLAGAANLVGGISSDLQGLDARLELIASDLGGNRDALLRSGESLSALADRLSAQAERLRSGFIEESLSDVATLVVVTLALFVIWTAVPAIGALGLGIWLRREVRPVDD